VDDPRHILFDDHVLVRVVVARAGWGTPAPGPGRRSLPYPPSVALSHKRRQARATFALAYEVEFA